MERREGVHGEGDLQTREYMYSSAGPTELCGPSRVMLCVYAAVHLFLCGADRGPCRVMYSSNFCTALHAFKVATKGGSFLRLRRPMRLVVAALLAHGVSAVSCRTARSQRVVARSGRRRSGVFVSSILLHNTEDML